MVETVKKGDTVYYVRDAEDYLIIKATVKEPRVVDFGYNGIWGIGSVHWDGVYRWNKDKIEPDFGGCSSAPAKDCFWTLEEAKQYVLDENNRLVDEYMAFMDSKEKVLLFPLKYSLCGEYGWDGKKVKAYKDKVKEYFGVELDD